MINCIAPLSSDFKFHLHSLEIILLLLLLMSASQENKIKDSEKHLCYPIIVSKITGLFYIDLTIPMTFACFQRTCI